MVKRDEIDGSRLVSEWSWVNEERSMRSPLHFGGSIEQAPDEKCCIDFVETQEALVTGGNCSVP